MNLHYFYNDLPARGTKFIATYADETGAKLFQRLDDGQFIDCEDGFKVPYNGWFLDKGFLYWEKI
ncbi:hypothetical protein [Pelistega sp. MC2]|uniref:hypothetical protein n=1 Tax=Pelistega sp. MC2 TaxID=1720297 RepID=UPI0008D94E60|nr:hypothetical protein [Pelistega sp. MC2]